MEEIAVRGVAYGRNCKANKCACVNSCGQPWRMSKIFCLLQWMAGGLKTYFIYASLLLLHQKLFTPL